MITLYLARHGETVDNVNKIMQGQTHGQLTLNGRKQAEELRDKMAETHLDTILASDLKRAIDTATIIAKPHRLPVITTELLRERDWGGFTGRYIPDLINEAWPDNIESIEQLKIRAEEFLMYLREQYNGQTVFAVGHGIINKAIQAVYYNSPIQKINRMENAEVRILHLDFG